MCTYNGEKYISEQMESIINQTYPVYELIIQDDRSTDETWTILQQYANKYPYIHIFQNEQQKGVNNNFFSAMERATGDYIAIADQDDIWKLYKIERQIAFADDFWLVSGFSEPFVGEEKAKVHFDQRVPNLGLERIIHTIVLPGHNLLFRKDLLTTKPDYRIYFQCFAYDHLITLKAAAQESVLFIPEVLVEHRRHLQALSYVDPYDYNKNAGNLFRAIRRTSKSFLRLRKRIQNHFVNVQSFLESIPLETQSKRNALKITRYQQWQNTFLSVLFLSFVYVRFRDKIFYAPEKNRILAVLRAFYFPISCSDYFNFERQ